MKYIKKILLSPWTALFTLALVLFIRSQDPAFLQSIRLRYFDTLITSKQVHQSESISVVNIDDETIRQFGQFPFPRDKYAQIIENLFKHNAGLVVFNIYTVFLCCLHSFSFFIIAYFGTSKTNSITS